MTNPLRTLCLLLAATLAISPAAASSHEPAAARCYLIGNSLTWDTIPQLLSGDVQWHVDCGKSLPFIYANPNDPCVKTSTLWPKALEEKQYDVVSVQPHYGSTLAQDVETISAWMKLQPKAVFVIHSGWAFHAKRDEQFHSTASETMQHSPAYYHALVAELRRLHPGRTLRQTRAIHLLAKIAEDVAAGRAPLNDVVALHRDDIHMHHDSGKYLMHNAMRHALGQPRSAAGFDKIEPKMRSYLDGVLALLDTSADDQQTLARILSLEANVDRAALVAKIADAALREKLVAALPELEQAEKLRVAGRKLAAEIQEIGGKILFTPTAPQWLQLAAGDAATEFFLLPTAIDLYNGANPLKGKGGRNDRVNDAWLERLSGVASLRKLDLANCDIRGEGLRHVAGLTGLRELNLTLTPVADDALVHLGGLVELRSLGLASTQCTGTGFAKLTALRKLESVNFHFTPLSDDGLKAISQVPNSGRFWFAHTRFTDAGAVHLAKLTQLRRCGIGSKQPGSSGEAVAALAKLPLEDLSLLDNQATPEGVAHAAKISTLKKLDVSYGPTVTDESLKLIAQLPLLEELSLGGVRVTDDGLQTLAAVKTLKKLTVQGVKSVTAEGVERLRQSRPELTIVAK